MALIKPDGDGLLSIVDTGIFSESLIDLGADTIGVRAYDYMSLYLELTAGTPAAVDQFTIMTEIKDAGTFVELINTWTVPDTGPFMYGDNIAATAHGAGSGRVVICDIRPLDEIKFQLAFAAGGAAITATANMYFHRH